MSEANTLTRRPLQGTYNVVRFNWPMYAKALLVICCLIAVQLLLPLPKLVGLLMSIGIAASIYFLCSSICASYLAYDHSGLYQWGWLRQLMDAASTKGETSTKEILNIHSGFDESTAALQQICPGAKLTVLDLYDKNRTTEPSISIANKLYPVVYDSSVTVAKVAPDGWPLEANTIDFALLFVSAHELRKTEERDRLFRELDRVLKADGRLVLVEHLRDWPNFLAFGPGFWHFFPYHEWLRATKSGGLTVDAEGKISPFIHFFCLSRQQ